MSRDVDREVGGPSDPDEVAGATRSSSESVLLGADTDGESDDDDAALPLDAGAAGLAAVLDLRPIRRNNVFT